VTLKLAFYRNLEGEEDHDHVLFDLTPDGTIKPVGTFWCEIQGELELVDMWNSDPPNQRVARESSSSSRRRRSRGGSSTTSSASGRSGGSVKDWTGRSLRFWQRRLRGWQTLVTVSGDPVLRALAPSLSGDVDTISPYFYVHQETLDRMFDQVDVDDVPDEWFSALMRALELYDENPTPPPEEVVVRGEDPWTVASAEDTSTPPSTSPRPKGQSARRSASRRTSRRRGR
jgi:hypothetical protein